MMKRLFPILIFIVLHSFAYGEDKDSLKSNDTMNDTIQSIIDPYMPVSTESNYFLTRKEFWLGMAVLFSLLVIIVLELKLIKDRKFNDETSVKLLLSTLVIIGALFTIMTGFTDTQLAPIFGLFGTIAGYLFGKNESKSSKSDE